MLQAIFFDNDGVLVDTEALYYQATRELLSTVDVPLSEEAYLELFLRQSRGAWHLAEARGVSAEQVVALKRRRDERFAALIDEAPRLIPGVSEVLARLAQRYRLAVVTSSDHFAQIHRHTGLLQLFEFVVTPADYRFSKPHPEPYLKAIERSGLQPEQCLVVEDSERGLRAAKAAGLTCWVVPSGLTRGCAFEGADRILGSVAEVESALVRTSWRSAG